MTRYSGPESFGGARYRGKFLRARDTIIFGPNLAEDPSKIEVKHIDIALEDGLLSEIDDLRNFELDDVDAGFLSFSPDNKLIDAYGNSYGFKIPRTLEARVRARSLLRKLTPGHKIKIEKDIVAK